MLKIKGPFCLSSICGGNVDFQVLSNDGRTEVGKISKKWTDFVQEESSDADIFGISFPVELDVKVKATLLGAVFLIDFMYFEDWNWSGNYEDVTYKKKCEHVLKFEIILGINEI